jgi:ribose 5-phosphate isomerase B
MRTLFLGSDHGGFGLKQELVPILTAAGYAVEDCGVSDPASVDYPDIAKIVCENVLDRPDSLGILLCGTGIGMSIAANKIDGIRAALCSETYSARMARIHNDANVLCLGARVIGVELAREVAMGFLSVTFEGGRHARRVEKITLLETTDWRCR